MTNFGSLNPLLTLTAALLASLCSSYSIPDIPYDGKNLHLNAQYRLRRAEFLLKRHTPAAVPADPHSPPEEDSQLEFPYHGEVDYHLSPSDRLRHFDFYNRHAGGPPTPYQISPSNDEEVKLIPENDVHKEDVSRHEAPHQQAFPYSQFKTPTTGPSQGSTNQQEEKQQQAHSFHKETKDAVTIFAIWSLDNMFWLIPFVAHSPRHAICFFLSYQLIVAVSCFLGVGTTFAQGMTFMDAHKQNMMLGAASTLFCWILASYFYIRFRQGEVLKEWIAVNSNRNNNRVLQRSDTPAEFDLETPLLEKPKPYHHELLHFMPSTSPSAWLTIGMAFLGALDDIFFVPVIVETHTLSTRQVLIGSGLALLIWICLAMIVAHRYQDCLSRIPIYIVLCVYACVLTGHSGYDIVVELNDGKYRQYIELVFMNMRNLSMFI